MQKHLKSPQTFNGKGPFGTKDKRNDAQMPGPSGPKTKARAKAMRKPPFTPKERNTMTLHDSIKQKMKDGWNIARLQEYYSWISEQNLLAIVRHAKSELKLEDDIRRGINLWEKP